MRLPLQGPQRPDRLGPGEKYVRWSMQRSGRLCRGCSGDRGAPERQRDASCSWHALQTAHKAEATLSTPRWSMPLHMPHLPPGPTRYHSTHPDMTQETH